MPSVKEGVRERTKWEKRERKRRVKGSRNPWRNLLTTLTLYLGVLIILLFCITYSGDLAGTALTSNVYQPGDYILTITAIDVEEQTATVQVNLTIQGVEPVGEEQL